MLCRQCRNLHLFRNSLRFDSKYANLYAITQKLFHGQTKLKNEELNKPEISINFPVNEPASNYDSELQLYLNKKDLQFDEVSDIVLKYGMSNNENKTIIYKEIDNYLHIKREINTFPVELHEKVLQYARDTSHIGVGVEKIRKQIKNELISIKQARIDADNTAKTMKKMQTNNSQIEDKLNNILAEFIDCVDKDLQKKSDLITKTIGKHRLSSKILAIIDSANSASIGIQTLVDFINKNEDEDSEGTPYNILCNAIGKEIERDLFLENKLSSPQTQKFLNNATNHKNKLHLAKHLGIKIGDSFDISNIYEIGGLILSSIIDSCVIGANGEPALTHKIIQRSNKQIGVILCNKMFKQLLVGSTSYKSPQKLSPIAQPMIIPPRPWKNINEGPFFYYNESLMRYTDYNHQYKQISHNNTKELLQCINILQSTSWRINAKILEVITYLYHTQNGNIAGLPNKVDYEVDSDKDDDYKIKSIEKKNRELHSLRCDLNLKLQLAKQLETETEIYFPLNIDFRGRIYPISPHVNHIGSDIVRGMMLFAKKKKLGTRGWFWLNVNLANKFGFDKVPNEDRFEWSIARKNEILSCGRDALADRWWLTADSPFQALSIIFEISNAYNSCPDAVYSEFASNLPVGQDGSCNGLQHYAAMLLDETMAKHVNVANNKFYNLGRGDVYGAVQKCVNQMVVNDLNSANAQKKKLSNLIANKITRKIVKQTVMTSVYGVTSYGAKAQIMRWILDAIDGGDLCLSDGGGDYGDIHSKETHKLVLEVSIYLSKYTMYGIGLTNTPAYLSMLWLKNCAYLIAKNGYRVSWMTPFLNLPCTQHYCNKKSNVNLIKTGKQTIQIQNLNQEKCKIKNVKDINVLKQSSAFPPNFVHSLDSTHCLMTARECFMSYGLTFASIHDSFWTHSCDVDTMSVVLREQFIKLHSVSLLSDLYKSFCVLYPDIEFAPPPNQSTFDLQQVKDSEFFFS